MALDAPAHPADVPSQRAAAVAMGFGTAGMSGTDAPSARVVGSALALQTEAADAARPPTNAVFVSGVNLALATHTVSNVVVDVAGRTVTWDAPPWTMPTRYLVEFRNAPADDWSRHGFTTATTFDADARVGGQLIRQTRLTCITSAGEAARKVLADLETGSVGEVLPNQHAYLSAVATPALPTTTAEALPDGGWVASVPAASAMDVYRIARLVTYDYSYEGLRDQPNTEGWRLFYFVGATQPDVPRDSLAGWTDDRAAAVEQAEPTAATVWIALRINGNWRSNLSRFDPAPVFKSATAWRFDPAAQPWRRRLAAPDVPTSLAASTTSATTATLVWMPPAAGAAVVGYEHRRRVADGSWSAWSTDHSVHPTTGELSTTLTGLTASTSYEFEVRATNAAGAGPSATVTFSTDAAPTLSAPTSVAVSAIFNTGARVTWAAPATGTPTGYQLRIRVAGGGWSQWRNYSQLRANLTGLLRGTAYEVQVRAVAGSTGGPSASASFSTTGEAGLPPGAPRSFSARAIDDATISLIWSAPTTGGTLTGYEYRYRVSGGAWPATWQAVQVFNVRVTGLASSTTYEFEVRSVGPNGRSAVVSATATTTAVAAPGAPRSVTVSFLSGNPVVSWLVPDSGGSVTDYEYRLRLVSESWPTTWTSTGGSRSVVLTGLPDGTQHRFEVRSRGPGGTSSAVLASFTTLSLGGALITSVSITGPAALGSGLRGSYTANVGAASRYDTLSWAWSITRRPPTGGSGLSGTALQTALFNGADGNWTLSVTVTAHGTGVNARDGSTSSRTATIDVIVGTLPLSRPGAATAELVFTQPSLPVILRVSFGAATGGTPPYTYKYRYASYSADGGTRTSAWSGFTAVTSPFSISGLLRGTNYQVQIYVHDSTGDPGISNSNFTGVFFAIPS